MKIVALLLIFNSMVFALSNPTKAFILSLCLPGAGQFYNGAILKGIIVSSTEMAFAYGIYHYDRVMDDARSNLDEGKFVSARRSRNDFIWALVGVVFLSSVDAYIDAHLKDFDLNIALLPLNEKTYGIAFSQKIK